MVMAHKLQVLVFLPSARCWTLEQLCGSLLLHLRTTLACCGLRGCHEYGSNLVAGTLVADSQDPATSSSGPPARPFSTGFHQYPQSPVERQTSAVQGGNLAFVNNRKHVKDADVSRATFEFEPTIRSSFYLAVRTQADLHAAYCASSGSPTAWREPFYILGELHTRVLARSKPEQPCSKTLQLNCSRALADTNKFGLYLRWTVDNWLF